MLFVAVRHGKQAVYMLLKTRVVAPYARSVYDPDPIGAELE